MDKPCELLAISRTRACDVWMCEDCNTVHLGIGPLSLRLKMAHFFAVVETLLEAAHRIRVLRNESNVAVEANHTRYH